MPKSDETYAVAVETSGRIGSVAIGQGNTVLFESSFSGFMKHSTELFDSLNALLAHVGIQPSQLGRLYVTAGPGSFTGIRIAVTLAKMAAYAIGVRIVAVDTLDALAESAAEFLKNSGSGLTRIATVFDAKQNRFFVSIYEQQDGSWQKNIPSSLLNPDEILALIHRDNTPVGLLGEGLTYHAEKFASPLTCVLDPVLWPAAARAVYAVGHKMAVRGQFANPLTLAPTYIRKPDAVEKRELKTR